MNRRVSANSKKRCVPNHLCPASSSRLAAVLPHPEQFPSRVFIGVALTQNTSSVLRRLVAASTSHASSYQFLFHSVSIREAPVYAAEIRASQPFCLYSSVAPSRTDSSSNRECKTTSAHRRRPPNLTNLQPFVFNFLSPFTAVTLCPYFVHYCTPAVKTNLGREPLNPVVFSQS